MKYSLCSAFIFLMTLQVFSQEKFLLFAGTYTSDSSKGIYCYQFDEIKNKITNLGYTEAVNPSFLAISPDQKNLFSVNVKGPDDKTGRISSFTIDHLKGSLNFINTQPSPGNNPCYIAAHKSGKWVAAGNYDNGTLAIYPVDSDGRLQPFISSRKHTGHGADTTRQTEPHVHSTIFSPNGKFLYVPDLGIDKIMIYRFNGKTGELTDGKQPFVKVKAGGGPRHFTFDPAGKFAYLVEELSGKVIVYRHQKKNGTLTEVQKISTVPENYTGAAASADIHISPDGKFLYASNRGGGNTIAVYAVEKKSGKLKILEHQSVLGKTPRNFVISNDGKYLLVANQNSDEIVIFKRDMVSGSLSDTGQRINVSKPVCLKIIDKP